MNVGPARLLPLLLVVLMATGCSGSSSSPSGGDTKDLPTCPASWQGTTHALVLWGDSASQRSTGLVQARLAAVADDLRTAASCGVPVTVMWVPGQSQTTTLFEGPVRKEGATDKIVARLSNKLIDEQALPRIAAAVQRLTAAQAQKTSSPAGLFAVIADERRSGGKITASVLDDFVVQDGTANLNRPGVTGAQARALATKAPSSNLSGVVVAMDGVAQTADSLAAPDDWAAAVRAYADALCARTKATCQPASTQYVGWGR